MIQDYTGWYILIIRKKEEVCNNNRNAAASLTLVHCAELLRIIFLLLHRIGIKQSKGRFNEKIYRLAYGNDYALWNFRMQYSGD